ncbi:thioredoxin-disulfide reductase [Blochmannia endosymbiont of Polyrhachis (Hedomyrma) turneri]|uniref:thioredoxin-disulfide reductase n=1 Tax=Blochmannia endosymbiont of Polyrhachis (Hedomyrma) turneri TaxID=1505596 RepID=UPI00061A6125|nr:thioredoxin-disulfide reductase [Blochmannia endosymbiont of Polyrhachis (Hedomyrma) turneri]AKC59952.1 Thioredoxin reductase [Blochmannia endosymbiont of Polyrhachis (Hedomyrma) turneri]
MSNIKHSQIIILGSGPAGYTAAIYSARANLHPILITGTEYGGQLIKTNQIENWPGDPDQLAGPKLMERMNIHAKKFNTNIIVDNITNVNLNSQPFYLASDYHKYTCDSLIICTGASAKHMGLHSETQYQGKGVSYCATCDGFFYKDKKVAIIGGGNTAIEEALYLTNIAAETHLIHRRNTFTAEKILIDRLMTAVEKNNIILHCPFTLIEILGNTNYVTAINIKHNITHQYTQLKVDGVFIAIGYKPNTTIFSNQLLLKDGYICTTNTKNEQTATSIPGIFAAGDVMDQYYKQAITAASSGCMAAIDAERYLSKIKNK